MKKLKWKLLPYGRYLLNAYGEKTKNAQKPIVFFFFRRRR